MKKVSRSQSRRNIEKRKNEVRVRHQQAGHWNQQSKPMFGRGKVHLEVGSKVDAMSFGGIAPVHCLLEKIGLISEINSRMKQRSSPVPNEPQLKTIPDGSKRAVFTT